MKRWTQAELDAVRGDLAGRIELGTGDFSQCNLYGRNRVVFGAHSILGAGMQLGEGCELGEYCQIGDGFSSRNFLKVGENCHFGSEAHIGFGSQIQTGCAFAQDCEIEEETLIREGVELPARCKVYGVSGVDGRSMLRLGPVAGRMVYAFEAVADDGTRRVYAGCTGVPARTLTEFAAYAAVRAEKVMSMSARYDDTWRRIRRAAAYIYDHFAVE